MNAVLQVVVAVVVLAGLVAFARVIYLVGLIGVWEWLIRLIERSNDWILNGRRRPQRQLGDDDLWQPLDVTSDLDALLAAEEAMQRPPAPPDPRNGEFVVEEFGDVEVVELRVFGGQVIRRLIRPVLPEPSAGYDLTDVSAALDRIDELNGGSGRVES